MSIPPPLDPRRYAAEAVILFGSRAAGVERAESDWDILVVGRGVDAHGQGLDVVVVEPEQFGCASWRDSELAGHVARWGQTLEGSPRWLERLTADHKPGLEAVAFKRRTLAAQMCALQHYWPSLGPWARDRRTLKLRRDLQRHARLVEGIAVPPTALLDRAWASANSAEARRLLAEAGFAQAGEIADWLAARSGNSSSEREQEIEA